WRNWIAAVQSTHESYLLPQAANSSSFADGARLTAAGALFISGVIALALAAVLRVVPRWSDAMRAFIALATLEVWLLAWHTRDTFDSNRVVVPELRKFLAEHPG